MGVATQQVPVSGHYEPEVGVVMLPRCANCKAPHPLARTPKMPPDRCPDCDHPAAQPGAEQLASTYLNFPPIVRLFMWIGRKLHALARRIEP